MSFFNIFSGKKPQAYEEQGDAYGRDELWGNAKVEYERALNRLEKMDPGDGHTVSRIEEKLDRTREALALEHQDNAETLIAGGYGEDARGLLNLALELTRDASLEAVLQKQLADLEKGTPGEWELNDDLPGIDAEIHGMDIPDDESEYFFALCGTLPDDVQMAYLGYGQNFKTGYLALNAGDFETASQYLSLALEDNQDLDTYIPLELATACLNQGERDTAKRLLVPFLKTHPDVLPAYQLLCEIYWETGETAQAEELLASVPQDLETSVAVALLQGETFRQAGNDPGARSFYIQFMETYGWQEPIARALAEIHEAMGEADDARNIYQAIMDNCHSCRARIDPFIKEKYADLCFSSGSRDTNILELYLSLAQEISGHASVHYDKVSQIYAAQGNQAESKRFRSFAEQLHRKAPEDP